MFMVMLSDIVSLVSLIILVSVSFTRVISSSISFTKVLLSGIVSLIGIVSFIWDVSLTRRGIFVSLIG